LSVESGAEDVLVGGLTMGCAVSVGGTVGDPFSVGLTITGDGVGRDVERGVLSGGRGVASVVGDGPSVGRNVDDGCRDSA
jgi:hypothetical protein